MFPVHNGFKRMSAPEAGVEVIWIASNCLKQGIVYIVKARHRWTG